MEDLVKFGIAAVIFFIKAVIGLLFYIMFILVSVKIFNLAIDGLAFLNRRFSQRATKRLPSKPLLLTN